MSDKADGSTVTEPIANGGVTPEMRNEFQKVVMGILKDAMPRMIKQSMSEVVPTLLEQVTASQPKEKPADKPEPEGKGEQARLKGLENTINELKQQLKQQGELVEQKEQARIDALMRTQVREAFAGVLGADNPNLGLVMDSYYDARKRFVAGPDGSPLVKFKSDFGDEEQVGLSDGMKRLAEKELKHLVAPKTAALPTAPGVRRGNPLPSNGTHGPSPMDRIMNDLISNIPHSAADPTQK